MSPSLHRCDSTRPILLAALGGALVSVGVLGAALLQLAAASSTAPSPTDAVASVHGATHAMQDVELARTECQPNPSPAELDADSSIPPPVAIVAITRAKERELRAAFVALERGEPGALDARADALLSGSGPVVEKVALLRALRDTASPASAHWLDVAVRTASNEASTPALSLPAFALEQLSELATDDAEALAALGRLAFDAGIVAVELRRRASAEFAAACAPDDLSDLSRELFREQDELVIASALSALESRRSQPQAQYVLALHQRAPITTNARGAQSSN